jgi:hypothetical protein
MREPVGWGSSAFAARMRDTITNIATKVIERERPPYRYGVVESIDRESGTCNVLMAGDEASVPVNVYGGGYPEIGVSVRVLGLRGDRYLEHLSSGGRSQEVRHEWADPYDFIGSAPFGTLESENGWTITRMETDAGVVIITHATSAIWNDRTTETFL